MTAPHIAPPPPLEGRRQGWLRGMKFTCRNRHPMEMNVRAMEAGSFRCERCGEFVYVLVVPALGGRRRLWVADVSAAEVRYIEQRNMDADGVLAYLEAHFPERPHG